MDFPDNLRKSHLEPTLCGGIIIFPYFVISIFLMNNLSILKQNFCYLVIFVCIFLLVCWMIGIIFCKNKNIYFNFNFFITVPLDKSLLIQSVDLKDIKLFISLNEGALFFTIFYLFFIQFSKLFRWF